MRTRVASVDAGTVVGAGARGVGSGVRLAGVGCRSSAGAGPVTTSKSIIVCLQVGGRLSRATIDVEKCESRLVRRLGVEREMRDAYAAGMVQR